ncbi:hypothetical protein [Labilibaculum manganireducens]|uniref:hypothetical protein n=1 Tax=Labilibaculum manganireducens TaxID=1940525 RepID=UPI0029F501BB|nr:hypothetical protein [Labilibaculum manganireducens]
MRLKRYCLWLMITLSLSCQGQEVKNKKGDDSFSIRNSEWIEVEKKGDDFQPLSSEWIRKIVVTENEIQLDLMESCLYKIENIEDLENGVKISIHNVDWYYKVTWIDYKKKISKWDYTYNGNIERSFSYYAIIKNNLQLIEKYD